MYFNFEDYRPEEPTLVSPISRREGVLLSIIAHLLFALTIVLVPQLPFMKEAAARREAEAEAQRLAELQRQRENARFVFVQPRLDTPALRPPPRHELSDQDRVARAPERAPNPTNPLPFARGNSPEREIADASPTPAPRAAPATPPPGTPAQSSEGTDGSTLPRPPSTQGPPIAESDGGARRRGVAGPIADALNNIQRYVGSQTFGNPSGGGGEFGPQIQFDTKGVEFGPWVRRFVAQVKRNWFIPYAAMSLRGHVILTFNVHRDGRITDLTVLKPSVVDAFTHAAYNAILASNPTQPLPPEYPDDRAFFTVTFYYNENPL
jgi:TonB family protein